MRNEKAKIKFDPKNARRHGDANKSMIRESLQEVGAFRSIALDGNNIIRAGNGVYEQAEALGYKLKIVDAKPNELIAVRRPDLKGKKAIRAALYDNRTGELSEWDSDILSELANQDASLFDGIFDDSALAELGVETLPEENDDDEHAAELVDKAEELQKKWKVRSGDIWQIGKHFIICGDCTNFDDWKKLLNVSGFEKVNGVFTSPPYAEQRKKQYGGITTDKYVDWWYDVQANVRTHLSEDGSFFVNIKPHCENGERVLYVFDLVLAMRRKWEWRFVDELCWTHQGMPGIYGDKLKNQFEPVYHFSIAKCKTNFDSIKYMSERVPSWSIGSNSDMQGIPGDHIKKRNVGLALPGNVVFAHSADSVAHAASFPISLVEFFIKAYSDEGDIWLDPFLGSGTTICAAHKNNRRGLGIEKLEKYVAVCIERIEDLIGKTPKRIK